MGTLRLYLALVVVLHHSGAPLFGNGGLAVEVFFGISGFLIALVINEKYTNSIFGFYFNRALRLYPSYLAVLLISFIALFLGLNNYIGFTGIIRIFNASSWNSLVIPLANISMLGQDYLSVIGYCDGNALMNYAKTECVGQYINGWHTLLIPQGWSLSHELYFYLIAPFVVISKKRTVLLFIVFSVVYVGMIHLNMEFNTIIRKTFLGTLHFFLLGVLAYQYIYCHQNYKKYTRLAIPIMLGTGLLLFYGYSNISIIKGELITRTLSSTLIILSIPFLFGLTKNYYFDSRLGDLSYPVYIVHILWIGIVSKATHLSGTPKIVTIVVLTIISSYAINMYIERPASRRFKISPRKRPIAEQYHPADAQKARATDG